MNLRVSFAQPHFGVCRQMINGVYFCHQPLETVRAFQVLLNYAEARVGQQLIDVFSFSTREIVDYYYLVAALEKSLG
jgi:hypothetical protein